MHWSDRLEKVGRALLWLTLALMFVMVPLGVMRYQFAVAEEKAAAEKAERKLAAEATKKAPKEDGRLLISAMGSVMRALNLDSAEGRLYFTNVSPRGGVVCVIGVATNVTTQETSNSLPSCEQVGAYASVQMKVMFAGATLAELCPKNGACRMGVTDVPDRAE